MKYYEDYLRHAGFAVHYINCINIKKTEDIACFLKSFLVKKVNNKITIDRVYVYDPVDNWLEKKLQKVFVNQIQFITTPMFINKMEENILFFKTQKRPFMKTFYEWQRKRLHILMDVQGKPEGGVYSFDAENRKKLPKGYVPKNQLSFPCNTYTEEAYEYVQKNFSQNYGTHKKCMYAVTHADAKDALRYFIKHHLEAFGPYEDAISSTYAHIHHSVLSPYLNVGLLTPEEVVHEILIAYKKKNIPIQSAEGYIRQIIGWREFIRAMYVLHGSTMRTKNFWHHTKKMQEKWWEGKTGLQPVDVSIGRVLETAYNHHIERLMVLGNAMLLSELDPHDVYEWFMTMYIDAYDWVMVPNVYGMSQFADGGIFATKPYISGSNYIIKMSDYKKGEWSQKFDTLFWCFVEKHESFFKKNPRFATLLAMRKKKV